MAGPIYTMFYARPNEAWFQLSKEEQDALFAMLEEGRKSVNGKVMLFCDSSWNSEKWLYWGVEEFPSMEAVQEFSRCLMELNWLRYIDSEILLGTAVPDSA